MFGNKCKCKTKICKCGKRKIGGVVGESGEERELSEYERRLLDEQKRIEGLKTQVNILPDIIKGLEKKISENKKKKIELEKKEKSRHSQTNLNNIEILNREIEDLIKKRSTTESDLEQAKKSLKYVTDAENKSTRAINATEKSPNKGIYNFSENTNIYCFSDIESNMPSEIKELMFQNTKDVIDYTPINLVSTKRAIVFTGDLIDRGAYTIRNLSNMLKLKEDYPDNVILIGGNRDINKIRMYHECCIPYIESTIFISNNKSIADIIELLKKIPDDKIFKHSICEIADTINIQGIVNPLAKYKDIPDAIKRKIVDINFVESYRNDIFRIKDMYANTLGSLNQIKFFRDEFIVLFGNDLFGFTDDDFDNDQFIENVYVKDKYKLLLKFIAMMNMVMGKYREKDTEEYKKLPECLQKYNGLYIKYIEKNHIMAAFTKKNNLYIASHSGIPYGKSATENDGAEYFFIPSEIGEALSHPITQNYATNIEKLNSNFNTFITKIKENKVNYNDEEFKKYVAMAASCLDFTITGLNSIASPVVSSVIIDKMRKESVNSLNILNNGPEYKYSKIYNIFGHQPGGFTPYVNRVKDDGGFTSYHINLDISKAENPAGISNKRSYVYLLIDAKGTEGTEVTEVTEVTGSNDSNVMLIGNIENNAPYVNVTINSDNTLIQEAYQEENPKLEIKYNIKLDDYCDKKIQNIKCTYKEKEKEVIKDIVKEGPMFLVGNAYYGMFGYKLVKFDTKGINADVLQTITMKGGKKKINKIYIKSNKRYMYGKRRMVIYLGKRGCEYVKTAGEYLSLAKFIRTNNKNKNKNKNKK